MNVCVHALRACSVRLYLCATRAGLLRAGLYASQNKLAGCKLFALVACNCPLSNIKLYRRLMMNMGQGIVTAMAHMSASSCLWFLYVCAVQLPLRAYTVLQLHTSVEMSWIAELWCALGLLLVRPMVLPRLQRLCLCVCLVATVLHLLEAQSRGLSGWYRITSQRMDRAKFTCPC